MYNYRAPWYWQFHNFTATAQRSKLGLHDTVTGDMNFRSKWDREESANKESLQSPPMKAETLFSRPDDTPYWKPATTPSPRPTDQQPHPLPCKHKVYCRTKIQLADTSPSLPLHIPASPQTKIKCSPGCSNRAAAYSLLICPQMFLRSACLYHCCSDQFIGASLSEPHTIGSLT